MATLLKGPECVPSSLATVSGLTITFSIGPEGVLLSLAPPPSFQNAHKLSHPSVAHSATPNVPFPLSFPLASPNLSCQLPSSDPLWAHSQVMCSLCLALVCVPGCPSLLGPINIAKPLPGTVHYCMYVVLFVLCIWANGFQVSHRCYP